MRRLPYCVIAVYAAYLIYIVTAGSWPVLQRFWTDDDAFFYITIARNIARGLGSTFDRISPTNGYQPLWLAIMAAAYRVTGALSPDAGLRVALALSSICLVAGAVVLVRLIERLGAPVLVVVLGVLGLLASVGFWFFGIETHLSVVVAGVFLTMIWNRWTAVSSQGGSSLPRAAALGLAGALLGLTRIDLIVWVAPTLLALAAARMAAGWPRGLVFRAAAVEQGLSAALVLAYLTFSRVVFGSWLPISAVLRSKPFGLAKGVVHFDFPSDAVRAAVIISLALVMVAWSIRAGAQEGTRRLIGTRAGFGAVLALCIVLHSAAILLFSIACEPRYLVLSSYAAVLIVAILIVECTSAVPARRRSVLSGLVAVGNAAIAVGLTMVSINHVPSSSQGYRDIDPFVEEMAKYVTYDTVVFQVDESGQMAWFCECRVINGDGLVNSWEFQRYVAERRVKDFLDLAHTEFVVDTAARETGGVVWVGGVDWNDPNAVDFPIVGFHPSAAVLHVGDNRLFRYPGDAITPPPAGAR